MADDKTLQEANRILEDLPEEKRSVLVKAIFGMEQKLYSGPLPPPEDFREYEKVLPGTTDRIVTMVEKQTEHRIEIEKKAVTENLRQTRHGQWIGAGLCLFFGVAGCFLSYTGHDALAALVFGTTILGIATVFVLNRPPKLPQK